MTYAAQDRPRIGWIGVGRMGFQLATRLLDAGHDVAVYNRTRSKAEPLAEQGATIVDRPSDLSDRDVVFTMVAAAPALEAVTTGPDGVHAASRPGPHRRRARSGASSSTSAGPTAGPAPTPVPGTAVRPGRTGLRSAPSPGRTSTATGQGLRRNPRPPTDLRSATQLTMITGGPTCCRTGPDSPATPEPVCRFCDTPLGPGSRPGEWCELDAGMRLLPRTGLGMMDGARREPPRTIVSP